MSNRLDALETDAVPGVNLEDDAEVDHALRAAVRIALQKHKEAGDYVVAWQDGHLVRIAAHDIVVPEETR